MKQILFFLLLMISVAGFGQHHMMHVLAGQTGLFEGLVSVWELDETSGTTAYDSYGSNDISSITDVAFNQNGKIGNSFYFNGSSSNVQTPVTALGNGGFSFSFWLKHNFSTTTGYDRIIAKGDMRFVSAYNTQEIAIQQYNTTNQMMALMRDYYYKIAFQCYATTVMSTSSWYHYVVVFDGDFLKIYCNSTLEGTSAQFSGSQIHNSSYPVMIGSHYPAQSITIYKGYIDQVAIWDRALSAAEVAQLYNSGTGIAYIDFAMIPQRLYDNLLERKFNINIPYRIVS